MAVCPARSGTHPFDLPIFCVRSKLNAASSDRPAFRLLQGRYRRMAGPARGSGHAVRQHNHHTTCSRQPCREARNRPSYDVARLGVGPDLVILQQLRQSRFPGEYVLGFDAGGRYNRPDVDGHHPARAEPAGHNCQVCRHLAFPPPVVVERQVQSRHLRRKRKAQSIPDRPAGTLPSSPVQKGRRSSRRSLPSPFELLTRWQSDVGLPSSQALRRKPG